MSGSDESRPNYVEATDENWQKEIFERSQSELVVVDFWAEWCAPCRMLAPVLEQLAADYQGRFRLVKVNTDAAPEAAAQFGISGIPAVFAVLEAEIVDQFQGVMPEEAIRSWLDRLLGLMQLQELESLVVSAPAEAESKLRVRLAESPHDSAARILLARALMGQSNESGARQIIAQLEERGFLEPEAEQLKAELELKRFSGVDLEEARKAVEASPDDLDRQLKLAKALIGHREYQQGFEICLEIVSKDRHGKGEEARELMVEAFRVLPEDSELTREYRRKLSLLLY